MLMPWLLALVIIQRLAELWLAARNTRRLLEAGAEEHGRGHYPLIVTLHTAWLGAMLLTIPMDAPFNPWWLTAFLALQLARVWVIVSLGPWWTTRIITLPGAPLVRRGPYRWLKHPNYLIVALEIAVLPLVFGAVGIAVVFFVLNVGLLAWRIRIENRALETRHPLGD